MNDRLLTWEEWLNEKEGNIPFEKLDSLIQATMKAQYEYDKKERLAKQDAKSVKARDKEWVQQGELLLTRYEGDSWKLVKQFLGALKRRIDEK